MKHFLFYNTNIKKKQLLTVKIRKIAPLTSTWRYKGILGYHAVFNKSLLFFNKYFHCYKFENALFLLKF